MTNQNNSRRERKSIKIIDPEKEERAKRLEKKKLNNIRKKENIIRLVFLCAILFLCGRVGYIKLVHGEEYEKAAVVQQTTQENEQVLPAKRGDILDRTGKSLAISTDVYTVFADVNVIFQESKKTGNSTLIDDISNELYEVLGYPTEDFKALFATDSSGELVNPTYYYVLQKEVPMATANELNDKNLIGIHFEEQGKRVYPYANIAAQTIGFIGGDGQSSNWGLENYYDAQLTGQDGRYFVSYDDNSNVRQIEIEPIKGYTLVTTIDLTMQQFCDELVDKYGQMHNAKNAGIIIMKPNTGEIVAMSEYPRFDINYPGQLGLVTDPDFATDDEALDDSEKGEHIYELWKNFNISNTFEPGSIFKPVTVAMALEEGIITNDDIFYCDGYKTFSDGTRVKCWIYDSTGGGHGKESVQDALANSCNVAMMDIAEMVGPELFAEYQKEFGYGSKTGIDLPGEEDANSLVYDADQLNEVELATGGFGQGFNATAIQDIIAFNATINGGKIMRPYVVSDILDSTGKVIAHREPEVLRQVISKETSDIIRQDMAATVEYGTGKNLAINGYSIGGKTGTAELLPRGSGKYALSFIGYIPVENPQYIAMGYLNEPDDYFTEHTSAVPMMKEVFQKLITYYNIPSDADRISESETPTTFVNDYTGNVVSAINDINRKGYNFEVSGSGDSVYKQVPASGQPIDENSTIILFVDDSGSEEAELVEVPNLVGLSVAEAENTLIDLGFDVLSTTDEIVDIDETEIVVTESIIDENSEIEEPIKTVTKQMPKAGVTIPKGTQIRLVYK